MRTTRLAALLALPVLGALSPVPQRASQGAGEPAAEQPVLFYWKRSCPEGHRAEGEGLLRRMRSHLDVQYQEVADARFFASPFDGSPRVHGFTSFADTDARRRFERGIAGDARWAALQAEVASTFEPDGAWSGLLFPLGGAAAEDPLKPFRYLWAARTPASRRFVARGLAKEIAEYLEAGYEDLDARAYAADLHEPGTIYLLVDYHDLISWQRVQTALLADAGYMALQERMDGLFLDDGAREAMLLDLEFDLEQASPHYLQGRAFQDRGDLQRAAASYRRALELDPEAVVIQHQLGHVLLEAEEYAGAEVAFRRRLELDPGGAEAHQDLAWAQFGLGDPAGALASLRESARVEPNQAQYLHQLAWELAVAPVELRDLDQALQLTARTLELRPDVSDYWTCRGLVLARAGQPEPAVEALNHSIAIDGETAWELFILAEIEHLSGDPVAARAAYERAVAWIAERDEVRDGLEQLRAQAEATLASPPPEAPADGQ